MYTINILELFTFHEIWGRRFFRHFFYLVNTTANSRRFFFTSSQVVNTICTEFPNDIHDMHNLWKSFRMAYFFHLVFTVCTELPNAALHRPVSSSSGRQCLRSASRGDLIVPRFRLRRSGYRAFAVSGPMCGTLFRPKLDNRVTIYSSSRVNWKHSCSSSPEPFCGSISNEGPYKYSLLLLLLLLLCPRCIKSILSLNHNCSTNSQKNLRIHQIKMSVIYPHLYTWLFAENIYLKLFEKS